MKLISLPDAKFAKTRVTIGKDYEAIGEICNGFIINADDGKDRLLVLKERFDQQEQR